MHSGGGSSNSVVSVAPATPIVKNMIGVAALVLEGRDRGGGSADLSAATLAAKSKDTAPSVMPRVFHASTSSASMGASNALYMSMDPMAVASAMSSSNTTASTTTSNWARAQNNRLAHIYRLKNRLLVDSAAVGQQPQSSNRSSPVPGDCDLVDDEASVVAFGGHGVFDPMQHLTNGRTCRLTTPRSFMNLQMVEKRQTSSSSSSSAGSSSSLSSGTVTASRRNSRSSPVPAMSSNNAMGTRTHCDDFLRTIGLLKGVVGAVTTVPAGVVGKVSSGQGAAIAVNNRAPSSPLVVVEDEAHYCDEVVSPEVGVKWHYCCID